MSARTAILRIGEGDVEVAMRVNPRARRLMVKVDHTTGAVAVVAPSERGLERAMDLARKESGWIAAQLERLPGRTAIAPGAIIPLRGEPHRIVHRPERRGVVMRGAQDGAPALFVTGEAAHAPRRLADWLRAEARSGLVTTAQRFAALIARRPSRITVRDTTSRWGSCTSAGALSFSWRLVLAPRFVHDYVVAHEVAHLREMNHGRRFWAHVERLTGDVAPAHAWLREHGATLHAYRTAGR